MKSYFKRMIRKTPAYGLALLVFVLAAVIAVVFRDFITFDKLYLFKDIGSDSINYTYPQYAHIAQYLRADGLPRWSFSQGMGQNIFPGSLTDPFGALLILAGKHAVAYGMAYAEMLKIFLAGVFFFLFLKKIKISNFAATTGAVLYSFCGFTVLGSGWGIFSTEAVYAALLLYAFERFYQDGKWGLFPAVTALIAVLQPFDLYLFGVFLFIYIVFRFLEAGGKNFKDFASLVFRLSGLGLLGAAAASFFLVNGLLQMLDSPRVAGGVSFFGTLASRPVFGLADKAHYATAVLRFFSSDMLGTGSAFKGWNNYLEAPLFYCGLLPLLLVPQLFGFISKRKKILYGALLAATGLPIVFPYFRYAYWLFAGDYYRFFSLSVAVVLLLLGVKALDKMDGTSKPRIFTLALTLAALLGALYYPYPPGTVSSGVRTAAAGFLAGYSLLLALFHVKRFRPAARALILLTVAAEAAYMSGITVNNRPVVTGAELAEKTGYNDYTVDAVAYLKGLDKSFYRIDKDFFSGPSQYMSINDAKAQDYYGTPSYHSFNQLNYIRFLREIALVRGNSEARTRWAPGLLGAPPLHSFASVKYAFSRSERPLVLKFGYVPLAAVGDVRMFENKYALPLGFVYAQRIAPADFHKLTQSAKIAVLYKACVVDTHVYNEASAYPESHAGAVTGNYTFSQYAFDIARLKRETLSVSEHGQNRVKGKITLAGKGILFFSIPFDRGWRAKVDGKNVRPARVNIGFMGLFLDSGAHEIELEYTPPYLAASAAVSLAALLLYGWLLFFAGPGRGRKTRGQRPVN